MGNFPWMAGRPRTYFQKFYEYPQYSGYSREQGVSFPEIPNTSESQNLLILFWEIYNIP